MIVWSLIGSSTTGETGCETEVSQLWGIYSTWDNAQSAAEKETGVTLQWVKGKDSFTCEIDGKTEVWLHIEINHWSVDDIISEDVPKCLLAMYRDEYPGYRMD